MRQVWFADDSTVGGILAAIKEWWDLFNLIGSAYGYYPKANKTYMILKDPDLRQRAEEFFGQDSVKITVEGRRHIGGVMGTEAFKEKFVRDKIEKWVKDVKQIAGRAPKP